METQSKSESQESNSNGGPIDETWQRTIFGTYFLSFLLYCVWSHGLWNYGVFLLSVVQKFWKLIG